MKTLIYDIIDRFGGRPAGSEQEKDAQTYLKGLMEGFCNKVVVEPFIIHPLAKFESLKMFYGLYWFTLILFFYSPDAAFFLSVVNLVLYVGHFVLYYHWLDFLFPKATSHNTVGTIEPTGEVKRTIIFSGHMDTTKEFFWWYHLKHPGAILTTIAGFMLVLWPIYLGIFLTRAGIGNFKYGWWFFAITAPTTLTMFFMHGRKFIDGAQDNLSGITLTMALGRHFAEPANRLKHTRIKVASFGSEEIGLQGATAYSKAHNAELKAENASNINLDGIKDRDKINIITREVMVLVKYPDEMVTELASAFDSVSIPYQKNILTVGATDGAAFVRQGIPSVAIVAQSMSKLDPTYHTRLDVPECVDDDALEDVKIALVRFVLDADARLS